MNHWWNAAKQFLSLLRHRKESHLAHLIKLRLLHPCCLQRPRVFPYSGMWFTPSWRISRGWTFRRYCAAELYVGLGEIDILRGRPTSKSILAHIWVSSISVICSSDKRLSSWWSWFIFLIKWLSGISSSESLSCGTRDREHDGLTVLRCWVGPRFFLFRRGLNLITTLFWCWRNVLAVVIRDAVAFQIMCRVKKISSGHPGKRKKKEAKP